MEPEVADGSTEFQSIIQARSTILEGLSGQFTKRGLSLGMSEATQRASQVQGLDQFGSVNQSKASCPPPAELAPFAVQNLTRIFAAGGASAPAYAPLRPAQKLAINGRTLT